MTTNKRWATKAEYQAATAAKALVKRLNKSCGKGWGKRVWENLGWHYMAISPCGRLKVGPTSDGSYLAFVGPSEDRFMGGRWVGAGATPEDAITDVVETAQKELVELTRLLIGFGDAPRGLTTTSIEEVNAAADKMLHNIGIRRRLRALCNRGRKAKRR